MNQPPSDTIYMHLTKAIKSIDSTFGEGYAKEHPELVGTMVQATIIDVNAKITARILKNGLSEIVSILEKLALTEE